MAAVRRAVEVHLVDASACAPGTSGNLWRATARTASAGLLFPRPRVAGGRLPRSRARAARAHRRERWAGVQAGANCSAHALARRAHSRSGRAAARPQRRAARCVCAGERRSAPFGGRGGAARLAAAARWPRRAPGEPRCGLRKVRAEGLRRASRRRRRTSSATSKPVADACTERRRASEKTRARPCRVRGRQTRRARDARRARRGKRLGFVAASLANLTNPPPDEPRPIQPRTRCRAVRPSTAARRRAIARFLRRESRACWRRRAAACATEWTATRPG